MKQIACERRPALSEEKQEAGALVLGRSWVVENTLLLDSGGMQP